MVEEQEKVQARVVEFCETLRESFRLPRFSKLKLPRATTASEVPVKVPSRSADRRFTREFSMRGRARGNGRANWSCMQGVDSKLEELNYGRCSEFSEKEQSDHCVYYVDAFGEKLCAFSRIDNIFEQKRAEPHAARACRQHGVQH